MDLLYLKTKTYNNYFWELITAISNKKYLLFYIRFIKESEKKTKYCQI